mmetsp:Transcript_34353/g.109714  ORF Transcript_34353/g.109714 Transcript_34353/m.109714 type:complete len:202 (+) Transcript_34353:2850-3455(+)
MSASSGSSVRCLVIAAPRSTDALSPPVVGAGICHVNGLREYAGPPCGGRRCMAVSTAPSRTACTMVPLYPNELTPPRRIVAGSTEGSEASCVGFAQRSRTPSSAELTCGFSCRSCALGGACDALRPVASRSNPVAPAAGSAWPVFALTLPSNKGELPARAESTAEASDPASIGSPSAVPVPWASTHESSAGKTSASTSAAL